MVMEICIRNIGGAVAGIPSGGKSSFCLKTDFPDPDNTLDSA